MRAVVTGTTDMRMDLVALTHEGPASARKLTRAHVLLQAEAGVPDRIMAGNATVHVPCTTAKARRTCTRGVPLSLRAVVHERARLGVPSSTLKRMPGRVAVRTLGP
jgi:hypothetical protein